MLVLNGNDARRALREGRPVYLLAEAFAQRMRITQLSDVYRGPGRWKGQRCITLEAYNGVSGYMVFAKDDAVAYLAGEKPAEGAK